MQIKSEFNDGVIQIKLTNLVNLANDMRPITRAISAVLASESETAFEKETSPEGNKWPELSPRYKQFLAEQGKTGKMLQRSMAGLAQSLQTEFDAVSAAIGTNKIYGAIHMFGGLPSMPTAPAAIPARPFMGLSSDGLAQIHEIIINAHLDAINN